MPAQGQGITRYWYGTDSANWSDPNNWFPVGTPSTGDTLEFGFTENNVNLTMNNDLSGINVKELDFNDADCEVDGNAIIVTDGTINSGNLNDDVVSQTFTTTINCPLIISGQVNCITAKGSDGLVTRTTVTTRLNGSVQINSGSSLDLTSHATDEANGAIFVSGIVSGPGDLIANSEEFDGNQSPVQFDGPFANTFTGTLYLTESGNGLIVFDKSSGVVASNTVAIQNGNAITIQLMGPNQLGSFSTLSLSQGSSVTLTGNNLTIGNLNLTDVSADSRGATLDTGSTTLGLNGGIVASSDNSAIHPIIKGKINFNGLLPVEVDGASSPGLEIPAVIEGAGFNKTGANVLFLDGNNTFTGNLEISAGTVIPATAAALSASTSAGVLLNGGTLQLTNLTVNNDPLIVDSSNSLLIAFGTCSWGGPVTLNQTLNVLPVDNSNSGLLMTFAGPIFGVGGMLLENAVFTGGNVQFSGSSPNTFSGPLTVLCQLLLLNKPASIEAFGGPLVVGGGSFPICKVSWGNGNQGPNESLTLSTNGVADLNGFNESFDAITFNGGLVETLGGQLTLSGPVTVNPAGVTALITGNLVLASGNPVIFNVGQGTAPNSIDLQCNANISGAALDLIKEGAGTMSLAGTNNYSSTTLVQQGLLDVDNASAMTTSTVVVSGGATLQFDVSVTSNQHFELDGDGVNGTLGAINVTSNSFVSLNRSISLDAETTLNSTSSNCLTTLAGVINGTGPLTKTGAGFLSFTGPLLNTYSGTTFINQGTAELSGASGIAAIPGNLVIGTKTSAFGNSGTTATVLQNVSGCIGGANVTVNGGSSYLLEGNNQSLASVNLKNGGSIQTDFGTLTLTGGSTSNVVTVSPGQSGASIITGALSLPSGGIFSVDARSTGGATPELDLQAGLSDQTPAGITKSGAGQMQLSAANSFSSPVTINGGKLTLAAFGALGNSTNTTVSSNGTLVVENSITVQNNSLTLNGSGQPAFQSLNGSNIWNGSVLLNQTAAIQVLPAGGFLNLGGAVSGVGGLTTTGAGTLQFQGTNVNTYLGLTTITAGVIEAGRSNTVVGHNLHGQVVTNEVAVTSIPGNAVIGSDAVGSPTAVLRSLREQMFPSGVGANVAVHLSGLLDLASQTSQKDPPKEFVQTLTGAGQLNIGANCSFTIFNTTPFVFSGTVTGAGSLVFDGTGTVTTLGNINNSGQVTVFNGDWELFGARHNGGISVTDARLGGDGTVDGAVVVSSQVSAASVGVDSHLPNPQGAVFHLGSLSVASGDSVQLSMFGPSPAGGNDQIVTTSGGVTLDSSGGTSLSTSFSYPPRAGDVIDLISVAAGQAISGTFSNFADGVVTLVGQTPVLPSYHGGAGHDFTLTVTNLALSYAGYALAEGNGNQTVEPDECNLLYVSLLNHRANSLTISNAYLRATNGSGVIVTVPVANFPTIPAGQTMSNSIPFQFSTDTNLPCGGAVGFELVLSVVNEGQFAIDFSPVSGTDCSHPTGPCDSCTVASGVFNINTPTTTNQILFAGGPSIAFPAKVYPGLDHPPICRRLLISRTASPMPRPMWQSWRRNWNIRVPARPQMPWERSHTWGILTRPTRPPITWGTLASADRRTRRFIFKFPRKQISRWS